MGGGLGAFNGRLSFGVQADKNSVIASKPIKMVVFFIRVVFFIAVRSVFLIHWRDVLPVVDLGLQP